MGFNRRKMEADRKSKADADAAARRATDAQVPEHAERLIAALKQGQEQLPSFSYPRISLDCNVPGVTMCAHYSAPAGKDGLITDLTRTFTFSTFLTGPPVHTIFDGPIFVDMSLPDELSLVPKHFPPHSRSSPLASVA